MCTYGHYHELRAQSFLLKGQLGVRPQMGVANSLLRQYQQTEHTGGIFFRPQVLEQIWLRQHLLRSICIMEAERSHITQVMELYSWLCIP